MNHFRQLLMSLIISLPILFAVNHTALAGTAVLTWNPPVTKMDGSPFKNLGGYKIYFGTTSHVYGTSISIGIPIGKPPSFTITNLGCGTYYFAVTAYDDTGQESTFSNEVSKTFSTPLSAKITSIPAPDTGVCGK